MVGVIAEPSGNEVEPCRSEAGVSRWLWCVLVAPSALFCEWGSDASGERGGKGRRYPFLADFGFRPLSEPPNYRKRIALPFIHSECL